jgi:hypothetical protein
MEALYFNGNWRMDLGFGNPNKTATLIAIFMVVVWALPYIRVWMFWISLPLFSALSICLVHTFSRGGMVAAIVGVLPLIICMRRPWPVKRLIGVAVAFFVILWASIYLQAQKRYWQGVLQEDRSISNRLALWKVAPTMMVDAPGGWGLGKSGKIYTDWYQPTGRSESYRTLVNSHLTWLVELGWGGRFFYILGWLSVFVICLPTGSNRWLAVPLGIWVTFFTGAWFSSIAESIWLWVVPAVALGWVIVWRTSRGAWPHIRVLLFPPILAAFFLICVAFLAPHSSVSKKGNACIIGTDVPTIWIVADPVVFGKSFPRPLREAYAKNQHLSFGVAESIADLPDKLASTLVLSGRTGSEKPQDIAAKLTSVKSLIIINPNFSPAEVPISREMEIQIAIGEFSHSDSASKWINIAEVKYLAGMGDFVPNWLDLILSRSP